MWKDTELCLGLGEQFCLPIEEQIKLFKRYCFDRFFIYWDDIEDIGKLKRYSEENEIGIQFIHAPYDRARELWTADSSEAVSELFDCLHDCARIGVDLAVFHSIIGFEMHSPNGYGIESFGKVIDEAERLGIKVAFENIEGEEYLSAIMDAFRDRAHVGFCWDSGHEQCYNDAKDMLALYGDRLMCVHLNDNLGMSDIHILPFDGIIDWDDAAKRLNRHGLKDR